MRISFWNQSNTLFSQKNQQNSPCIFPGLGFTKMVKNPLSSFLKQNQKTAPSWLPWSQHRLRQLCWHTWNGSCDMGQIQVVKEFSWVVKLLLQLKYLTQQTTASGKSWENNRNSKKKGRLLLLLYDFNKIWMSLVFWRFLLSLCSVTRKLVCFTEKVVVPCYNDSCLPKFPSWDSGLTKQQIWITLWDQWIKQGCWDLKA